MQTDWHIKIKKIRRWTDRQIDRQTDRQEDRNPDKQGHTDVFSYTGKYKKNIHTKEGMDYERNPEPQTLDPETLDLYTVLYDQNKYFYLKKACKGPATLSVQDLGTKTKL